MDAGMGAGGVVNGWPWGSVSHTNTVVALLHWKGVWGSPLKKVLEMEYLVHSRPPFWQNQSS